jgi:glycosyltransferase involved in cell wall biosynthesis
MLLVRGLLGSVVLKQRGVFPSAYSISQFVSKLNVRTASKVYVAYDEVKQWADNFRLPNQERAQVLHNAVDPDLFHPIPIPEARQNIGLDLKPSEFVIGFVGSLQERHGLVPLLEAFYIFRQRCRSAKLLIVGDGPQLPLLRDLVHQKGLLEAVVFAGFIPHINVPMYMAACDVLYGIVANEDPSSASNPIKCYEYLACERPIVTTKTAAFSFVQEENVGRLIRSLEPSEIAGSFEGLYYEGKGRKAMGNRGRRYVIEHHTWKQFADAIVNDARLLMECWHR